MSSDGRCGDIPEVDKPFQGHPVFAAFLHRQRERRYLVFRQHLAEILGGIRAGNGILDDDVVHGSGEYLGLISVFFRPKETKGDFRDAYGIASAALSILQVAASRPACLSPAWPPGWDRG